MRQFMRAARLSCVASPFSCTASPFSCGRRPFHAGHCPFHAGALSCAPAFMRCRCLSCTARLSCRRFHAGGTSFMHRRLSCAAISCAQHPFHAATPFMHDFHAPSPFMHDYSCGGAPFMRASFPAPRFHAVGQAIHAPPPFSCVLFSHACNFMHPSHLSCTPSSCRGPFMRARTSFHAEHEKGTRSRHDDSWLEVGEGTDVRRVQRVCPWRVARGSPLRGGPDT